MSAFVDPKLAAFAAELSEAVDNLLDKYDLTHHRPVDVVLTTCDGIAAKFWEEGIEFYPEVGE